MKAGPYFLVLLMGVACVVLTVALIVMAYTNQQLQDKLQVRQQALSQGVLGQQAQQISAAVLQDLADAAVGNPDIRELLAKHEYRVSASRARPAGKSSPEKKWDATQGAETPQRPSE